MKVLCATDGSAEATYAASLASSLPVFRRANWTVASVAAPISMASFGAEPLSAPIITDELQRVFEAQVERCRSQAEMLAERLRSQGIDVKCELLEGDAGAEICAFIEENQFDLVVVGHRGIGGIAGMLLGSVAKYLVGHSPCSVFVGRKEGLDTLGDPWFLGKPSAGVGYDASPGAKSALDSLVRQGSEAFERLYAICGHPLAALPPGIDAADLTEVFGDGEEAAIEAIREAEIALSGLAPTVSGGTGLGNPAEVLIEFARARNLDMIVIGASRHGTLERLLVGSTSMDVVSRAPCSVWLVRPAVAN